MNDDNQTEAAETRSPGTRAEWRTYLDALRQQESWQVEVEALFTSPENEAQARYLDHVYRVASSQPRPQKPNPVAR